MDERKIFGYQSEAAAVKHLKKCGYKIVTTNYVCRYGEVDIICQKDDFLVFVEVKSRTSVKFGYPRQAVNYVKQQKIILCAKNYTVEKKALDYQIRFDVVEVTAKGIDHIIDAFRS